MQKKLEQLIERVMEQDVKPIINPFKEKVYCFRISEGIPFRYGSAYSFRVFDCENTTVNNIPFLRREEGKRYDIDLLYKTKKGDISLSPSDRKAGGYWDKELEKIVEELVRIL